MQLPAIINVRGIRALTSEQIACCYEVKEKQIRQNFVNNRRHYIEGKHFIAFTGDDLRAFKNSVENFDLVGKNANVLYLWTEKGALLHAKSLNTDKAWEVYDYLVDHYFRAQEAKQTHISLSQPEKLPAAPLALPKVPTAPPQKLVVDVPQNTAIQRRLERIKRIALAMDVIADSCSRYSNEELYNGKVAALNQLFLELARPVTDLHCREVKPKLIEQPL